MRRSKARVIVYIQAAYFFGAHRGIAYSPLTRLRIWIERAWFHRAIGNCDEVWVQTQTVADGLAAIYPGKRIAVVPLIDEKLSTALAASRAFANDALAAIAKSGQ